MAIYTDILELLIFREKVKLSHFDDATEIGNICSVLECSHVVIHKV